MEKQSQSQNAAIRRHLEAGNSITPLEALDKFNCLRLGARIYNLIHDYGMAIKTELVAENGKRFARYSLAILLVILASSCRLQQGSWIRKHTVKVNQMDQQYRASDPARYHRNAQYRYWHMRPTKLTQIPFTNRYF